MRLRPFAVAFLVLSLVLLCFAPLRKHLSLAPTSLTFAPQVVGTTSAAQSVQLTSSGGVGVTIKGFTGSGYYSQTNDCPVPPSLLQPRTSCAVDVTFASPIIGPFSGTVAVSDDAAGNPHVIMLSGTAVPPVTFSPVALSFGSVPVGTTSSPQAVTLTNNLSVGLTINGITTTGNYSQRNNCPASSTPLGAGQSCAINVAFQPTTKGSIPGAISLSSNASPGTQPVGLSGQGTGRISTQVAISPATLDFGSQEAGTASATQTVMITNISGSKTLSITSLSASASVYQVTADSCSGQTLPASRHCTFNVSFQPTANFATVTYPGAITVMDSDPTSTQVVGLAGLGVPPVTSAPSTVNFGTLIVGNSGSPQTVVITNKHNTSESLSISSSAYFPINASGTTCTNPVAAGGTCNLQFTFSPPGIGNFIGAGTIVPSSGGPLNPTVVNLAGCQTNISLTPPRLDFGMTSGPETATLANLSGNTLNIAGTPITGTNGSDFAVTSNTCGASLVAGSSCTLDLSFTSGGAGIRNGMLNVNDDGACSPQQLTLIGQDTGPFIATLGTEGTGSGNVNSSPSGIDCGSTGTSCSASYAKGTSVILTAVADPLSMFSGWSQACLGTRPCTLNMAADRQVVATFNLLPVLSVNSSGGNGSGTVTSSPAGINCGSTCTASYAIGTPVTLSESASPGSSFGGWGGACQGTTSCVVTMNGDQSVTASFISPDFSVSASSPNPLNPGQSGVSTITLGSINGFASPVSLTCSVQATGLLPPTCSINPTTVKPAANGIATAQMTLSTTGPSGYMGIPAKRRLVYALLMSPLGVVLIGSGLLGLLSRRRRLGYLLLLGATVAALVVLEGCGGSNRTGSGTPAGAYVVNVNASSGPIQHSIPVTLTVN